MFVFSTTWIHDFTSQMKLSSSKIKKKNSISFVLKEVMKQMTGEHKPAVQP